MAHMNPGLIRLHSWEMMGDSKTTPSGWVDTANKTWDAAKIRKNPDRRVFVWPGSDGQHSRLARLDGHQ